MMAIVQSRRGKEGRQNIRWEEGVKPGEFFCEKFLKVDYLTGAELGTLVVTAFVLAFQYGHSVQNRLEVLLDDLAMVIKRGGIQSKGGGVVSSWCGACVFCGPKRNHISFIETI